MKKMQRILAGLTAVLALGAQAHSQQQGQGGDPAMAGMGRMVNGTVTAAAPDKLTVKTEAGDVYQVALTANTRLMKDRQQVKVADVHVGDGVGAMGEIDQPTKTVHAMFVTIVDAEQVKKLRDAMGKTYIAGKVTAIDELKLMILRRDGVSQVIAVDEDTSFRKGMRGMQAAFAGGGAAPAAATPQAAGGESITLADIKVGDNVAGPGALKKGVFVPTTLGVGGPGQDGGGGGGGGQGGRRRRSQGDGTGAPAATPAAPAAPAPAVPPTPNAELN